MFLTLPIGVSIIGGVAAYAITKKHLNGDDLSRYDRNFPVDFHPDPKSEGAQKVVAYLRENFINPANSEGSRAEKLAAKRKRFDQAGLNRQFDCSFTMTTAQIGDHKVDGEWVQAKGADPNKRIFYIHGGANTVGSAISHRAITTNLSERTGCAVFAANYRLMPENSRMDGIDDCRMVYQWLVDNGPNGAHPAERLAVGGDSAGGNLTLSLINWVRDQKGRQADAVFAISPATDSTCTSPSFRDNYKTDLMLQPLVGNLLKIPRSALLWLMWRAMKISPANPVVSPIFADLSNLPPTLIHVSSAEMLYDDARRYVAKAQSQGSPATIQIWDHMAHVWHIFDSMLPESNEAIDEIVKFLKGHGISAE